MKKNSYKSWIIPLLPAFVLLGMFFIAPAIWAIYVSFTNMNLTGSNAIHWQFVGFYNYYNIILDNSFWTSLLVTAYFLFGSVAGQLILGLLLAVYLKGQKLIIRSIVEIFAIIAWVMPEVVTGFAWISFLNYPGGLGNVLISFLGLSQPWLFTHPLFSVTVANIWRGSTFSLLMFIAALDGIPKELPEAAKVDGGNQLQIFFHVTLPLIKTTILTDLVLITLFTIGAFTLVFTMTSGGPGDATDLLSIYAYRQAFNFYSIGYGSAVSVIMLIIGILLSITYVTFGYRSEKPEFK